MTIRAAQNLQNRGFKSHEIFCFLASNTDHVLPVFLASIALACPTAAIHSMLSKSEMVRILTKIKPKVAFCESSSYDGLKTALDELQMKIKIFTFGEHIDGVESVENLFIETGEENQFV